MIRAGPSFEGLTSLLLLHSLANGKRRREARVYAVCGSTFAVPSWRILTCMRFWALAKLSLPLLASRTDCISNDHTLNRSLALRHRKST